VEGEVFVAFSFSRGVVFLSGGNGAWVRRGRGEGRRCGLWFVVWFALVVRMVLGRGGVDAFLCGWTIAYRMT
jgi:hypothetical protein